MTRKEHQELYEKGWFKLTFLLRKDIGNGRFIVKKTDLKNLGKLTEVKENSVESIEKLQSLVKKI